MYSCDAEGIVLWSKEGRLGVEIAAEACSGCGSNSICGRGRKLSIAYKDANKLAAGDRLELTLSHGIGLKLVLLVFGGGLLLPGLVALTARFLGADDAAVAAIFIGCAILWVILCAGFARKFRLHSGIKVRRITKNDNKKD